MLSPPAAPLSPRASPQNPHKSASAAGGPHKNPTYETALLTSHERQAEFEACQVAGSLPV